MINDPIDKLSWNIACLLKRINPEIAIDSHDIQTGLAIKISYYGVIVVSAFFSIYLGTFFETALCMISLKILRGLSGGRHLPSLTLCMVFTVSLFVLAPLIELTYTLIILLNIFTVLLLFKERSTLTKPFYCFAIVGLNLIVGSSALSIIFFVQGLSLIRR